MADGLSLGQQQVQLGAGGSGSGSVGHGGKFQQLLAEATAAAPCYQNLTTQTQCKHLQASAIALEDLGQYTGIPREAYY